MYVPHLPEKNMQVCALAWQAAEKRAEASSEALWDIGAPSSLHKNLWPRLTCEICFTAAF
jgi:hypothetical protein